jgi:hypothetical protein
MPDADDIPVPEEYDWWNPPPEPELDTSVVNGILELTVVEFIGIADDVGASAVTTEDAEVPGATDVAEGSLVAGVPEVIVVSEVTGASEVTVPEVTGASEVVGASDVIGATEVTGAGVEVTTGSVLVIGPTVLLVTTGGELPVVVVDELSKKQVLNTSVDQDASPMVVKPRMSASRLL